MRKSFLTATVFFLLVMIGFSSCKPKKHIISATSPLEEKTASSLYADVLSRELQFSSFSSKLNLSLTSGSRSVSSKANLKIVKGRQLQLSIQPLFGIEMVRIYVDTDTVVVLDRMNKRFVKESLVDLKDNYPFGFDYNTLESLLTNRLFTANAKQVSFENFSRFNISYSEDFCKLQANDAFSGLSQQFMLNANDNITVALLANEPYRFSIKWSYDEFTWVKDKAFPYLMQIEAVYANKKINSVLSFSDVVLDQPLVLSKDVPKGYSAVALSDILKMITTANLL